MFRVIAGELSFASDFFHSPLPIASLGTKAAALHFLLSLLILSFLTFMALVLVAVLWYFVVRDAWWPPLLLLALVLALVDASTEISDMVDGVRSNWTKISIIGHYLRCRHRRVRGIFACLLKYKHTEFWKHQMRQTELLEPCLLPGGRRCPCACARRLLLLFKLQLFSLGRKKKRNQHNKAMIDVPLVVKNAILRSFRASGGKLSAGAAAVRRHHGQAAFGRRHDITWACRDGGGDVDVATTTDAILVWHIATSLFDIIIKRDDDDHPSSSSSSSSSASPSTSSVVVARTLSRYCAYLVAEAPDLLPDNSDWTKRRYEDVRKGIEEAAASKCSGDLVLEKKAVYGHQLLDAFSGASSHEVLNKGARLAKQLVEEAGIIPSTGGGGEAAAGDAVWELLSEFWSEMVLYLAPSDNVKGHIEGLQRGGELITLLWALLLHAGITIRPEEFNPVACVLVSSGEPESIC